MPSARKATKRRDPQERDHYHPRNIAIAKPPADIRARPPASANIKPATVAVRDPTPGPDRAAGLILATINTKTDVLEEERRNGLISPEAFATGRDLQEMWEKLDRVGPSGQWTGPRDRVDATASHEAAIAWRWWHIAKMHEYQETVVECIGRIGLRFLEKILRDGVSFAAYAASIGRAGPRGEHFTRGQFRWLLEQLAHERKLAN